MSGNVSTKFNDAISYLLKKSSFYMNNNEYSFAKCYLMTAGTLASENILIKVCFCFRVFDFHLIFCLFFFNI